MIRQLLAFWQTLRGTLRDLLPIILVIGFFQSVVLRQPIPNFAELLSGTVCVVDPDMDIRYCARLSERFERSRAPVIENAKIIGIVSFTDMVLQGLCKQY